MEWPRPQPISGRRRYEGLHASLEYRDSNGIPWESPREDPWESPREYPIPPEHTPEYPKGGKAQGLHPGPNRYLLDPSFDAYGMPWSNRSLPWTDPRNTHYLQYAVPDYRNYSEMTVHERREAPRRSEWENPTDARVAQSFMRMRRDASTAESRLRSLVYTDPVTVSFLTEPREEVIPRPPNWTGPWAEVRVVNPEEGNNPIAAGGNPSIC